MNGFAVLEEFKLQEDVHVFFLPLTHVNVKVTRDTESGREQEHDAADKCLLCGRVHHLQTVSSRRSPQG